MTVKRWLAWLSPILTALILAGGIATLLRADSMSGSAGTSIDLSACVTTTANSLCDRVAEIGGADSGSAVTSNSYLDRLLRVSALSASDTAGSLSKITFDNNRFIVGTALSSPTANSIGDNVQYLKQTALAGTETASSIGRITYDNTRFLMGTAISGATTNSIADLVNKFAKADLGGAITTDSALDRIRIWKSIQQGTVTCSSCTSLTSTATITSVTAANSIVINNGCDYTTAPDANSLYRMDLTNATTVTITRRGTGSATVTCNYTVLEFK